MKPIRTVVVMLLTLALSTLAVSAVIAETNIVRADNEGKATITESYSAEETEFFSPQSELLADLAWSKEQLAETNVIRTSDPDDPGGLLAQFIVGARKPGT